LYALVHIHFATLVCVFFDAYKEEKTHSEKQIALLF